MNNSISSEAALPAFLHQFLLAVWLCSFTSCRSALSRCVCSFTSCGSALSIRSFPFFSLSTTYRGTSLTSTCSSSFHNCFARQLSVTSLATSRCLCELFFASADELCAHTRADPLVLLRTLLHVLRGLVAPSITLPPSAPCAWRSLAPELGCYGSSLSRRHPFSVRSRPEPECGCDRALRSLR